MIQDPSFRQKPCIRKPRHGDCAQGPGPFNCSQSSILDRHAFGFGWTVAATGRRADNLGERGSLTHHRSPSLLLAIGYFHHLTPSIPRRFRQQNTDYDHEETANIGVPFPERVSGADCAAGSVGDRHRNRYRP